MCKMGYKPRILVVGCASKKSMEPPASQMQPKGERHDPRLRLGMGVPETLLGGSSHLVSGL